MKCSTLTIGNLRDRFKYRQLELNPPYQRRPVWKTKQRILLLSSIFSGIPIPAIIFHKHYDKKKNKDVYDVLDGKQRIETILHFINLLDIENEGNWIIKVKKNSEETLNIGYSDLKSKKFNKENNNIPDKFWNYEIPVIEYEGELADFFENSVPTMDVFVRINSTGSPLRKNEIRHANNSAPFFKMGEELEKSYLKRFTVNWKIFSENEVSRYVFHEFILELCTSIYFGNYTDKRRKLEELIYNHKWSITELNAIKKRFTQIVGWLKSIFSDEIFTNTRFRNKSDFYSLFVVLNNLVEKKYVTTDKKGNRILGNTLLEFSKAAQLISSELKSYDIDRSWKGADRDMLQYVIATRQSTDSLKSRQIRNDFLQKLLKGFVLRKRDNRRIFDENTKGILWTRLLQRYKNPKCPNPNNNPKCKKVLTEDDTQIDHVHPWSTSCNKHKSAKV
jgi:hypothetical protein